MLCIKMKTKKYFYLGFIFLFILISISFFSAASYGSGPYGMGAYGIGYTTEGGWGNASYLYIGHGIKFEFNHTNYTARLDDIINKIAIMKVYGGSKSWNFNLSLNQIQKIDLNNDEVYDVQILLKEIGSNWVVLDVKSVKESIPAENVTEEQEEETTLPSEKTDIEALWAVILFLVLGLIILTIIGLIKKIKNLRKTKFRYKGLRKKRKRYWELTNF